MHAPVPSPSSFSSYREMLTSFSKWGPQAGSPGTCRNVSSPTCWVGPVGRPSDLQGQPPTARPTGQMATAQGITPEPRSEGHPGTQLPAPTERRCWQVRSHFWANGSCGDFSDGPQGSCALCPHGGQASGTGCPRSWAAGGDPAQVPEITPPQKWVEGPKSQKREHQRWGVKRAGVMFVTAA